MDRFSNLFVLLHSLVLTSSSRDKGYMQEYVLRHGQHLNPVQARSTRMPPNLCQEKIAANSHGDMSPPRHQHLLEDG